MTTVKVGFTGTQSGATNAQITTLIGLLTALDPYEFHHGMCIGADEDAHKTILMTSYGKRIDELKFNPKIIGHPPLDKSKMTKLTLFGYDRQEEPKEYLERNQDIVDAVEVLIACPSGPEEIRSGTWATIRRARKKHITIHIINPDGSIITEN